MRQVNFIFIGLALLLFTSCAGAGLKTDSTALGPQAVDFALPDQDGKIWKLSDTLKDYRAVVLAFYPKDDTKE